MTDRIETGDGWELRLGDYREVLADVKADCCITDPPYSERTHSGHDSGVVQEDVYRGVDSDGKTRAKRTHGEGRRALQYGGWDDSDVANFSAWADEAIRGQACSLTSHDLAPSYESHLQALGRYVFAPLACVSTGTRIRLCGDGPSNWAWWLMVSRPSTREYQRWGTLPGAYVVPGGHKGMAQIVTGEKPLWLMQSLVRDYSRPGDLVCDPCAGGGTTLLAAVTEGRRAIGAEIDPATFELAVARLRKGHTRSLFEPLRIEAQDAEQVDLFRGEE